MSDRIIYARGDPKTTQYVQQLNMIAGLVEVPTIMYLTSTHWGDVVAELDAQYRGMLMDPTKPAPWDLHPNKPIKIGQLTVVNSGTEDQEVCNLLNHHGAEIAAFGARRDALRTS